VSAPTQLDVLFGLLGSSPSEPVDGGALTDRLHRAGFRTSASSLLSTLLRLEDSGHVAVQRRPTHSFGLTERGAAAAHDLGPGVRVDVVVLMVDLVGFVAFTDAHGDDAARRAATALTDAADTELRARGGRLVKSLGDGILGTLPSNADASAAVLDIARRCTRPDGSRWAVRAAARHGTPIAHGHDLYGADVNLVARMCAVAAPDELVVAVGPEVDAAEHLEVRGLADRVPVVRVPVA
jgi:class 3 adenylate cyclase